MYLWNWKHPKSMFQNRINCDFGLVKMEAGMHICAECCLESKCGAFSEFHEKCIGCRWSWFKVEKSQEPMRCAEIHNWKPMSNSRLGIGWLTMTKKTWQRVMHNLFGHEGAWCREILRLKMPRCKRAENWHCSLLFTSLKLQHLC